MEFWDQKSNLGVELILEKRNAEGLNMLEYSALYPCPEEKMAAVHNECDRQQVIRVTATSLYRLQTLNQNNVNFKRLIDRLSEHELFAVLTYRISVFFESLLHRLLLYQGPTSVKTGDLIIGMFQEIVDDGLLVKTVTEHWEAIQLVLKNSQIANYLVSRLSPRNIIQILSEHDGDQTPLQKLVTQSHNIDRLLKPLSFDQIRSLMMTENEDGQYLLDIAHPNNFMTIIGLYEGRDEELLELCLNHYVEDIKPSTVIDCLTFYLICITSKQSEHSSTLKEQFRIRFELKEPAQCISSSDVKVSGSTLVRAALWLAYRIYTKVTDHSNMLSAILLNVDTLPLSAFSAVIQTCTETIGESLEDPNLLKEAIGKAYHSHLIGNAAKIIQTLKEWIHWNCSLATQYLLEHLCESDLKEIIDISNEALQNILLHSISENQEKSFQILANFFHKQQSLLHLLSLVDEESGDTPLHTAAQQPTDFYINTIMSLHSNQKYFNQIHDIICLEGAVQRTVFHCAISADQFGTFITIVKYYKDKSVPFTHLVSIRDEYGDAVFSTAAEKCGGPYISTILKCFKDSHLTQIHELLSVSGVGEEQLSSPALHVSIKNLCPDFSTLISYYKNQQHMLFELISFEDNTQQTALHIAASETGTNYFLDKILSQFNIENFLKLHELMCKLSGHSSEIKGSVLRAAVSTENLGCLCSILDFYGSSVDKFLALVEILDQWNNTVLHIAAKKESSIFLQTILSKCSNDEHFQKFHKLLSSENDKGLNPLMLSFCHRTTSNLETISHFYDKTGNLDSFKELTKTELLVRVTQHSQKGWVESDAVCDVIDYYSKVKSKEELVGILTICLGQLDCSNLHFAVKYILITVCELVKSNPENYQIFHKKIHQTDIAFEMSAHRLFQCIEEWYKTTSDKHRMSFVPAILIIYNTNTRPGAVEEAESLIKAFTSAGLSVTPKSDLQKQQMLEEIRNLQETIESKSALIVVMMSHGVQGSIYDNDGQRIEISEIERTMCVDSHSGVPKVLILQCCQGPGEDGMPLSEIGCDVDESEFSSCSTDSGELSERDIENLDPGTRRAAVSSVNPQRSLSSYTLKSDDFLVIMSTVPGEPSNRNHFIPLLAEVIKGCSVDESLIDIFQNVQTRMKVSDKSQTSLLQMTLNLKLNIMGSFQSFLSQLTRPDDSYIFHQTPAILIGGAYGISRSLNQLTNRLVTSEEIYKEELLESIEHMKESMEGRNGQVTIIVGSGDCTHLHDHNGIPIHFSEIEKCMCDGSQLNTPKVLIIHTYSNLFLTLTAQETGCEICTTKRPVGSESIVSESEYTPSSGDFCVIIIKVSESDTSKSQFMQALTQLLIGHQPAQDLVSLFDSAFENKMKKLAEEYKFQYDELIIKSNLKHKFYLKATLPRENNSTSSNIPDMESSRQSQSAAPTTLRRDFSQNVTSAELESCGLPNKRRKTL